MNIHIHDKRAFKDNLVKYLQSKNEFDSQSSEEVGLKELFQFLGPNDFSMRAVYHVVDEIKFNTFAKETYLNYNLTTISSFEELQEELGKNLKSGREN